MNAFQAPDQIHKQILKVSLLIKDMRESQAVNMNTLTGTTYVTM